MLDQKLDKTRVIGKHVDRPRFNLRKDARVEVLDGERHAAMLANVLTFRNGRLSLNPGSEVAGAPTSSPCRTIGRLRVARPATRRVA